MRVDGRLILGYGGSESIQSPRGIWSENALLLLRDLGIDLARFESAFDRDLYPNLGLSRGVLFKREHFGMDKLVTGDPTRMVDDDIAPNRMNDRDAKDFITDFPISANDREGLIALYKEARDVISGRSSNDKEALLSKISYRDFLKRYWGLSDRAADTFQKRSQDFFALGIDAISAFDAASTGYPGFQGLGLKMSQEAQADLDEPYIYHFPDGNASIARLLVRKLIPSAAPGSSMEDIVTAHVDYSRLDLPSNQTRLRLNSTVVTASHTSSGIDVGYVHEGTLKRVEAKAVVYAGYNTMWPYIQKELPSVQRTALSAAVKAPLVYVKAAIRNWRAWMKAGVHEVTNPMGFYSRIKLDYPVSLGSYQFPRRPDEPIGLHLVHVPTPANSGDQRTAWRAGRAMLFNTPYEVFENHLVDELARFLGPHGFDEKRDLAAIAVYRWGHGYAYGTNSLFDDEEQEQKRLQAARQPIGRITIANSDSAGAAYAHAAIDEARRAVDEVRMIVGSGRKA